MAALHPGRHLLSAWLLLTSTLLVAGCHRGSPTEPDQPVNSTMNGSWHGSADRGPCAESNPVEDWTSFSATLLQDGDKVSGRVLTGSGSEHPVIGTLSSGQLNLGVADLPNTSTCYSFAFISTRLTYDSRGSLVAISGNLQGRCCGTVAGAFHLTRIGGA